MFKYCLKCRRTTEHEIINGQAVCCNNFGPCPICGLTMHRLDVEQEIRRIYLDPSMSAASYRLVHHTCSAGCIDPDGCLIFARPESIDVELLRGADLEAWINDEIDRRIEIGRYSLIEVV